MKITIDIPEKIVNLAAATLTAQTDDEEIEMAVSNAVKSLNEEAFTTDLSELEEKAYPIKLALAMFAIGQKVGEYKKKKEDNETELLKTAVMGGFAKRMKKLQEEREQLLQEQKRRKEILNG